MNEYKVILPNLDRRPDRWQFSLELLLAQGVPRDKIERFPAFDVLEFRGLPDWQKRIRESISAQFGCVPFFLERKRRDGDWAWSRTWYTILTKIASGSETVLLLVDDILHRFTYDETCQHIELLEKEQNPLAIVNYRCCPYPDGIIRMYTRTEWLDNIPGMMYGLSAVGDACVLYTPLGAQRVLDFIDAPERDEDGFMIHCKNGRYEALRTFRQGTAPELAAMATVFMKDTRGCYSMPQGRIDSWKPNYKIKTAKMAREDRVEPPRRLVKTRAIGKIPLPRAFDFDSKYTLDFMSYEQQGYLELRSIVHPTLMFQNYGYRSSLLSDQHIEERQNYGKTAFISCAGTAPKSVLEIASNDGYLLNRYAEERLNAVGVEPATNLHQYIDSRCHVYGEFFNLNVAQKIADEHGTFDIVHAHNVLGHTPDPVGMLLGLSKLMHERSVLVLEFEYLIDMLEKVQFYHMYHEHYFYFAIAGLQEFLKCVPPLHIMRAERVEAQGGSILCALTKSEKHDDDETLKSLLESEREYLNRPGVIDDFVANTECQLKSFVKHINAQPIRSVQGLFANAKAVVILNLALSHGLELDRFRGFYDDATELQGNKFPGTNIPILRCGEMEASNKYPTVLFAPNLKDSAKTKFNVDAISVSDILEGKVKADRLYDASEVPEV